MNANFRNFALWVIIGLVLIALFNLFQNTGARTPGHDVPYSQFLSDVDRGRVRSVVISGQDIAGRLFGRQLVRDVCAAGS